MILTAIILSAPILAVWLVRRGQRAEPPREFNPDWGGPYPSRASHQRADMRKQYAERGLPLSRDLGVRVDRRRRKILTRSEFLAYYCRVIVSD